jgi:antitoxin HicB
VNAYDYLVVVHPDAFGGFWSEVPALPGCGSQGETMHEAIEMTKDAIRGFIESMRKHGDVVPGDDSVGVRVQVRI